MPRVTISHPDKIHVDVSSPYNMEFILAARELGGVFKKSLSVWRFNSAVEGKLREHLAEVYGYTDDSKDNQDVDIAVKLTKGRSSFITRPLYLGGLPIARATGRDSGAVLHGSVALLEGDIDSSGSVKKWYVEAESGTELLFTQVPRYIQNALKHEKHIEFEVRENPSYNAIEAEQTDHSPTPDLDAIRERIADIEVTIEVLQKSVKALKGIVGN